MKKRIWRKHHSRYLEEIVYEISTEHEWRAILFAAPTRKKFRINCTSYNGLSDNLVRAIRKKDLRYFVSVVPHSETVGWENWDPTLVYFKFETEKFPEMVSFSANNPSGEFNYLETLAQ